MCITEKQMRFTPHFKLLSFSESLEFCSFKNKKSKGLTMQIYIQVSFFKGTNNFVHICMYFPQTVFSVTVFNAFFTSSVLPSACVFVCIADALISKDSFSIVRVRAEVYNELEWCKNWVSFRAIIAYSNQCMQPLDVGMH